MMKIIEMVKTIMIPIDRLILVDVSDSVAKRLTKPAGDGTGAIRLDNDIDAGVAVMTSMFGISESSVER